MEQISTFSVLSILLFTPSEKIKKKFQTTISLSPIKDKFDEKKNNKTKKINQSLKNIHPELKSHRNKVIFFFFL